MKIFNVNLEFSPATKPTVVIEVGSYPVIDWRNDGFAIEVEGKKVFVSIGEQIAFGKLSVKMVKDSEKEQI